MHERGEIASTAERILQSREGLQLDLPQSMPADLPEPELTENARMVLVNRYLKKDKRTAEVVETPKGLFWRVAAAVAAPEYSENPVQGERWARRFYGLMASCSFMPNSPTLMNAGREMGMLSACFVLPVEDSIESIFTTLKNVALIQKAGGGTGFSFSRLRPDGDLVSTSGGKTSGPLSFIDTYSAGTDAIQQGAFRRGANMGVLHCTHPDVVEFTGAKDDLSRWTNYNVSVAATHAWMQAATERPAEPMVVVNPRNRRKAWLKKTADGRRVSTADYDGYAAGRPDPETTYWTYGEVLDRIIHFAWKNGEPGLLFIDAANANNPVPHLGDYEATNPCGEQWLLPYSSCNLGSINLGRFYKASGAAAGSWENRFDWEAFDRVVADTTRFLDDVVTINRFPIPEIRQRADQERRIGLGVMGFADLLYRLGIRYGSEQSLEVGRVLAKRLTDVATAASEDLVAREGREPFEAWEGSRPQREGRPPRRNSTLTTVAPTGTISIIAGCSGGIEPLFSLAFQRQVMKNSEGRPVVMAEVNGEFQAVLEGLGLSGEEADRIIARAMEDGSIAGADVPDEVKNVFVTARDVTPREHILMQGAWQTAIDNAVSKTINLPRASSEDDVRTAYLLAWREGCKGVTVYRDGCREMQPMALKERGSAEAEPPAARPESIPTPVPAAAPPPAAAPLPPPASAPASAPAPVRPARLPEIMPCLRIRQMTPFGNMHVKISVDARTEKEMEVFAQLGKGGDVANSDLEAICRMISLFLRCGGEMGMALKQLEGIGSSLTLPSKDGRIMSLADGLAKALQKYSCAKTKCGLRAILLGEVDCEAMLSNGNGHGAAPASGVVSAHRPAGLLSGPKPGSGMGGAFKLKCPACSGVLALEEGCCKCYSCGFSQC